MGSQALACGVWSMPALLREAAVHQGPTTLPLLTELTKGMQGGPGNSAPRLHCEFQGYLVAQQHTGRAPALPPALPRQPEAAPAL